MIDVLEGLRLYLVQSGTDLYTEVSDRVFIDPPGCKFPQYKRKILSFSEVSGSPMVKAMPLDRMFVDFKGWASSPKKATAILLALDSTFTGTANDTITDSGVTYSIRAAVRDTSIQALPDDSQSKGWSGALVTYEIVIQTDAVA
jgi:hypothetical protein